MNLQVIHSRSLWLAMDELQRVACLYASCGPTVLVTHTNIVI